MSNIAMQGGATGTGTVTLLAPVTNTNRTINLPDSNGTVVSTGSTAVVSQAMLAAGVAGNGPAFSASVASQSISDTTLTIVQFTTVAFDTASCYSTSTYRFTPNVAGYYWFSFTSSATVGMTGETFAYISKNGAGALVYDISATSAWSLSGGTLYSANGTTDYFSVSLYHTAGAARTFDSNTRFHGYLVRAA